MKVFSKLLDKLGALSLVQKPTKTKNVAEKENINLVVDENGVRSAGHQYVDLGLSVYWATMNVGAKYDYEYGKCVGWGSDRSGWIEKKYIVNTRHGRPDYLTTLLPEDDAAHCSMGGDWRMPMVEEMTELVEKCSWQAVLINHAIPAYQVTGPNGNSILLSQQDLWTSSLYRQDQQAYCLVFGYGGPRIQSEFRWSEKYVRGVLDKATAER